MAAGMASAMHHWGLGVLSPMYPSIGLNASVFFAVQPDLTCLQAGCYAGIAAAAFGLIVLRGHHDARGLVVPLLRDAASDRAIPCTPVRVPGRPLPVCLHPAYARSSELAFFDTMVNKIAAISAGRAGSSRRSR
jgi:hypothetical protein